ncbi:APC family permease [Leucobacter musarum]|uniref:APC family permease n=1 Tax=Leucobacter musarum TaxID=1930747 RepID=UPI0006A7673F|nr:APC family permease [Leucobacter musarum]
MSANATSQTSAPQGELRGKMGTLQLALTVLAMAGPLGNVIGVLPLGITRGNGIGTPTIYLFVGLIFLLFAVGFTTMTRNLPKAGAFNTYITAGLGRPLGLGAGYLTTFTYFVFVVGSYAFFGVSTANAFALFGITGIPWWLFSLAEWMIIACLGYFNVEVSGKVLAGLMAVEVGLVMLFNIPVMFTGGPEGYQFQSFQPEYVLSGDLGVATLFAIACYIGFETTVIYRDEVKNPRKTIPRAMYIAIIGLGLFYSLSAWCLVTFWGPDNVAAVGADDPTVLFNHGFLHYFGQTFTQIMTLLVVTSVFAGGLSTHNAFSRYLFMLGRDGNLPRYLGTANPRFGSPSKASITGTVLAVIFVLPFILGGMNPVTMYASMFGFGTFSLIVMFVLTSVAVLRYFRIVRHSESVWNTIIAPVLAVLGMGFLLVLSSIYYPMSIEAPVLVASLEQLLLLLILAAGVVVALRLRRSNPAAYRRIGNTAGDHHDERQATGVLPIVRRQ